MRQIPPRLAERLVAAAVPIALRGLNDTKIEDIVAVTGIPKATLYYYFDGKEDVFAFLLDDLLREVSEKVEAAADSAGTGAVRLGRVISAQLRVMTLRPMVCRALLGELSRAARMPVVAEMIDAAYLQPVATVLVDGAADGSLVAQNDPRAAAIALFGAVSSTAMTYLIADDGLDEALVTATVCSLIVEGLRPR